MRKETYDFEAKREYHALLRKFVEQHFPEGKRRRSLRVACLPGHEGLEVTRVYLPLGIRPERIWGIEHDAETFQDIQRLNLGINLPRHPISALDFFGQPGESFDIINLDFQSQMKDEEALTISTLFQQGRASPRCVLGTNFYGSRESEERKDHYQRSITYFSGGGSARGFLENSEVNSAVKQWIDKRMDFNTFQDRRDELDVVRDKMISLELRYLTSCDRVRESFEYLNSIAGGRWMQGVLQEVELSHVHGRLKEHPEKYAKFINSVDGFLRAGLMHLFAREFARDEPLRNTLYLFTEASCLRRPRFITDFYKGRYVSDNGSPMFFDFLTVQKRPELFKNIHVQIDFQENAPIHLVFHEGYETRRVEDGVFTSRLGDSARAVLARERLNGKTYSLEEFLEEEGVLLVGEKKRFEQRIGAFSEFALNENQYVNAERTAIQIKSLGERVRDDLLAQKPEAEILEKYQLSKQELAGHKAALSRQGMLQPSASELYQPTTEEEEQITAFIEAEIVTDEQIISSYNLTKMQLAARKARLTREKNRVQEVVT